MVAKMNSREFEKQTERILRVLEAEGAAVTWSDRIKDPDNPEQLRQIDVSIRRADVFTLVECRYHARPQDVKWIEELYGRKVSLGANSVIAVSASCFTEGAIRKAERLGVFTRDLVQLSNEEIKSWGRKTKVRLSYVKFEKIDVFLITSSLAVPSLVHPITMFRTSTGAEWPIGGLFKNAADQISKFNCPEDRIFRQQFFTRQLFFGSIPIPELIFQARWRWIRKQLELPSILSYGQPGTGATGREAYVEKAAQSRTEIHHARNGVVPLIDVVAAHPGDGAFLREVDLDLGEPFPMRGTGQSGLGFRIDAEAHAPWPTARTDHPGRG
jgi:hypothetical protein